MSVCQWLKDRPVWHLSRWIFFWMQMKSKEPKAASPFLHQRWPFNVICKLQIEELNKRKLRDMCKTHVLDWPSDWLWSTLCAQSKPAIRMNFRIYSSIKFKHDQSVLAVQAEHAHSTNSLSSTQKELKIHGQKGHLWRSRAVGKKMPSTLSDLPHTFTKV